MQNNKGNRTCIICGTRYDFCPNGCKSEDTNKPLWHTTFCSDKCHDLFCIAEQFRDNKKPVEELYDEVMNYNFKDIESEIKSPSVRALISDILASKNTTEITEDVISVEEIEETVGSVEETVEEVTDAVEEVVEEEAPVEEAVEETIENNANKKFKNYGKYNGKHYHKNKQCQ